MRASLVHTYLVGMYILSTSSEMISIYIALWACIFWSKICWTQERSYNLLITVALLVFHYRWIPADRSIFTSNERIHVFVVKLEIKNLNILQNAITRHGFRKWHISLLNLHVSSLDNHHNTILRSNKPSASST